MNCSSVTHTKYSTHCKLMTKFSYWLIRAQNEKYKYSHGFSWWSYSNSFFIVCWPNRKWLSGRIMIWKPQKMQLLWNCTYDSTTQSQVLWNCGNAGEICQQSSGASWDALKWVKIAQIDRWAINFPNMYDRIMIWKPQQMQQLWNCTFYQEFWVHRNVAKNV